MRADVAERTGETARMLREYKQQLATWPALQPLPELVPTRPKRFPFEALGKLAGEAAASVAQDVQAPDSLAAASALAAASLVAMPHADVVLPHGQRCPLSLYMITGALSGDRKSAVDAVMGLPLDEHRRQQAREYSAASAAADKDAPKPRARSLTISRATIEGLQDQLAVQPYIGLFSPEGAELLAGHSLREERRAAGLAWLLKAWSGETLDALTRGNGLKLLLGRRVALHLLVQPVVLRALLSDPLAQGQGLLARCLIAQPDTLAGTRMFRDVDPAQSPAVVAFHSRLRMLLAQRPQCRADGDGHELQPRMMPLGPAARRLWIGFHDEAEQQQAAGGELEYARAFGSKLAEHAARLAAILEMLGDPEASSVGAVAMEGGIELAGFYADEHVRLTGAAVADRQASLLRMLLEWMRQRAPRVPHRDVLQRSPNAVRALRAEGINKLFSELQDRGYVRRAGDSWEVRPDV